MRFDQCIQELVKGARRNRLLQLRYDKIAIRVILRVYFVLISSKRRFMMGYCFQSL